MDTSNKQADNLVSLVENGLRLHNLTPAIEEINRLRQNENDANFQSTLSDATSTLHKAGQITGLAIVGSDRAALLLTNAQNHYFDLGESGSISSLGVQGHAINGVDLVIPKSVTYDPSTNTGYFNIPVAANQTQLGLDTTLSRVDNTGMAAETQTQVGKYNLMYEHDLGDRGQDMWVSSGVGNDGNNTLAVTVSNQSKPAIVYTASLEKDEMQTLSINLGLNRSIEMTFRARL